MTKEEFERTHASPDELEALERLVDRIGVHNVLDHLAIICGEKAEHLRDNWQDKTTAALWVRAAVRIENIVDRVRDLVG
jgi:hypothetical protein